MRLRKVSAISFDLDDTLWPFQPAVERAEAALHAWLTTHAPKTADILPTPQALKGLRDAYELARPDLAGNFQALRIGSIRHALDLSGDDVALADAAYDVFFSARQEVEFFEDVWPALTWLSTRFPLVAVTNGNADLRRTGGSEFFRDTLSARALGIAKPEAGIFLAAAKAADVPPNALLHVGDDLHLDVLGALNAGLQARWLLRQGNHALADEDTKHAHLAVRDLSDICRALGGP